jgi:uncharacterized membrane protein
MNDPSIPFKDVDTIEELASLRHSLNVNKVHDDKLSFGDKIADKMADIAGSWAFIISFAVVLIIWIAINTVLLLSHPFDPYPFILLNLVLSCVAAMQATVIMMSQNRQEKKDRIRSEQDYEVNLKAEILVEDIIARLKRIEENETLLSKTHQDILKALNDIKLKE